MAIQSESLEKISNKDTDNTLSANSDIKYPSQKAVKTYIDNIISAANALVYKGTIDCSGNPNYPAADAGWDYVVSVSGKIGGASGISVDVGDMLLCKVDSSASGDQATVGTNWNIIEKNIVGAVSGPDSAIDNNIALFDNTTGKIIKDSGKNISIDGTFESNSDNKVPTEKAVKTYSDTKIALPNSCVQGDILYHNGNSFIRLATGIKQQTLKLTYDIYTKLLIHFDNFDTSNLYRAETGQTLSFYGTAQLDNSQQKFGDSSLLLDGNSDYITIPDSDDWYFDGDFTIDFWVRFNSLPAVSSGMVLFNQYQGGGDFSVINLQNISGTYRISVEFANTGVSDTSSYRDVTVTTGVWYHIALVASGNISYIFLNGIQQGDVGPKIYTTNLNGNLYFGAFAGTVAYLDGHLDEIRISKGIARWTSNFTPHSLNYENYDLIPTWAKEAWIDYSAFSRIVGWSSFTTKKIYYKQVGNMLYVAFDLIGTSNSTEISFTLPLKTATNPLLCSVTTIAEDNGTYLTSPGRINISNSYIVTCYKDLFIGAWTNSGEKRVMGNFFAELA